MKGLLAPGGALKVLIDNPLSLSLYLPWFIYVFARGLLIPVLPLYADTFDISYGIVGVILAGEAIGTLVGDIPAGMALRRIGARRTAITGIMLAALSVTLLFWARTALIVLALRLIAGLGRALFTVSQHVYLASEVQVQNRGRAIALYGGVARIGIFGGPLVGGAVAAAFGLRAVFILFGLICLIAWISLLRYLKSIAVESDDTEPSSARDAALRVAETVRTHYRVLAAAGMGQALAQMLRAGRVALIPLFGADVIGLDVAQIGLVVGLAAALDMTLFYPAGVIMDRFGRKYAIVPTFMLQAFGMALVPLTGSFLTLLGAMFIMSFANGLSSGTMMTLGSDLAPEESRGEFLGVWRLIGDVGHTGGPLAVGGIADVLSLESSALAIAGGGFMAAAIFAFAVPETLKRRQTVPTADAA